MAASCVFDEWDDNLVTRGAVEIGERTSLRVHGNDETNYRDSLLRSGQT